MNIKVSLIPQMNEAYFYLIGYLYRIGVAFRIPFRRPVMFFRDGKGLSEPCFFRAE